MGTVNQDDIWLLVGVLVVDLSGLICPAFLYIPPSGHVNILSPERACDRSGLTQMEKEHFLLGV